MEEFDEINSNWKDEIEESIPDEFKDQATICARLAMIEVLDAVEDCKNFHEVCNVVSVIRLKYNL